MDEDDSNTTTVIDPTTGSVTVTVTDARGVKIATTTTVRGEVTATIKLPQGMTQAQIILPVKNATATTVASTLRADGSRKILASSVLTADGLRFTATGDMTVQLIDNKVSFKDVLQQHWAAQAIAFTASRELFQGTGQQMFSPAEPMSRAMLFSVLAQVDGVETKGGVHWYSKALDWAVASGISDGHTPEAGLTREQLVTMLHRYAGQPVANSSSGKHFADSDQVSAWARNAMNWAMDTGLLNGKPGKLLAPASVVTRAEAAVILTQYITAQHE